MGKDKKEKKVNDIQETDCYQEGDTTETIPDEDTGCTNESQELTELEAELQKVREEGFVSFYGAATASGI